MTYEGRGISRFLFVDVYLKVIEFGRGFFV
jgi:hypothetical protein